MPDPRIAVRAFTVAELKAFVGARSDDGGALYFAQRGDRQVTAWTGPVAGRPGWWWAVTPIGERRVLAMGWTSGGRADRDLDIKRAITRTPELAQEASS